MAAIKRRSSSVCLTRSPDGVVRRVVFAVTFISDERKQVNADDEQDAVPCSPIRLDDTFSWQAENTTATAQKIGSCWWCNNNNNNNNNRISIASYGRNFRGDGDRSDRCSVEAWLDKIVLSLDLKTDTESLMRTVCDSEFQTDGAENRKARLEKSVLMNGWTSRWVANKHEVRLQAHSAIRRSNPS